MQMMRVCGVNLNAIYNTDIHNCMLDEEDVEVVTVIAGYIARQTNEKTKCDLCPE